MSECKNFEKNKSLCNCSYEPCGKKYTCSDCLHYHRKMGQLPACFFADSVERTYDRSIARFVRENR